MAQWLRLHASNAGGLGSTPDQGTKIPQTELWSQIKKLSSLSLIKDQNTERGEERRVFG